VRRRHLALERVQSQLEILAPLDPAQLDVAAFQQTACLWLEALEARVARERVDSIPRHQPVQVVFGACPLPVALEVCARALSAQPGLLDTAVRIAIERAQLEVRLEPPALPELLQRLIHGRARAHARREGIRMRRTRGDSHRQQEEPAKRPHLRPPRAGEPRESVAVAKISNEPEA
jgi:hypothetical protein